jgi:hypothetical protein
MYRHCEEPPGDEAISRQYLANPARLLRYARNDRAD